MSVGASIHRLGARERVRGRARFGPDVGEADDLWVACKRVWQAPARIVSIDTSRAESMAGVVAVFTAADIPGEPRLGIIPVTKDQEFLAVDVVRHAGQAVAVVVARDKQTALAGARAVEVRTQPMAGVFDPFEALGEGAPLVHPDHPTGNLQSERVITRGDVDAAIKAADVVVEATYTTSMLEHAALEPEGGRASVEDGRLVVWACTQNPHYDQQDIARFLGLKPEDVRVIQAETGGGFGGKLDLSVQVYLALAAWKLRRGVRMVYSREESMAATAKRHPFTMHYITAADRNGKLLAVKADLVADTGAFASYALAVTMRAAVHAVGPYYVPNVHVRCRNVYTNNPWCGAMRGFGVPQVAVGHEGQMNLLAAELGMDPIELRIINALRPGLPTATGQVLPDGVGMVACLKAVRPHYERLRQDLGRAEGVGVGAMYYGIGNTGVPNPSTAQAEWRADGRVVLYTGAAEIGQGSDTVLVQMLAESLGLEPGAIELVRADTGRTTNAGATSASRQTYISGNAVVAAASSLKARIRELAASMAGCRPQDVELAGGVARCPGREIAVRELVAAAGGSVVGEGRFDPPTTALDPATGQGSPYAVYAFAAQVARVRVDDVSGRVEVEEVVAAHDVGKAINPRAVEGQICGGVVMGVGMALMERFVPGTTTNLDTYLIPTAMDAPRIVPIIVEEPAGTGPFGAKGVGEPALIPTAPAIAHAVGQALGRPMRDLPIDLERVMAVLEEAR